MPLRASVHAMMGEVMEAQRSILPVIVENARIIRDSTQLLYVEKATIRRGRCSVVIGANGAGKSLFLRLCHGLIAPDSGTVRFAERNGVAGGRKRHAMVFQKPIMLRRSVSGNVLHALESTDLSSSESKIRAMQELKRFGMAALANRPARKLSGGEQQRLAIARAASLDPELLFLDEPTASLDPSATRQIEDMLQELRASGITLVLATHDLAQARRFADDILFFDAGRLAEVREAGPFFQAPVTHKARMYLESRVRW